jgi:hypothetical protein
MSEDQGLIGNNREGSKDDSRSVGNCMSLDLFSYNSSSLVQYDQKNPKSSSWRMQKIMICACFVMIIALFAVILVAAGPLSKIGDVKSTKFYEEEEPKQEIDFSADTLPLHHVVSLEQSKQDLIHNFCANGQTEFCKSSRRRRLDTATYEAQFDASDANTDGFLDLAEWSAGYKTSEPDADDATIEAKYNEKKSTDSGLTKEDFV